jgi:hypothetical protein
MKKLLVVLLFLLASTQIGARSGQSSPILAAPIDCASILDIAHIGIALVGVGRTANLQSRSDAGHLLANRVIVLGMQILSKAEDFLVHNNCSKT